VRSTLQANSSLALHHAALSGLGVARMPRFVVDADLSAGRLVQLLPGWQLPEQGIFAVTVAREHLPQKTRAFIDFFRARLAGVACLVP